MPAPAPVAEMSRPVEVTSSAWSTSNTAAGAVPPTPVAPVSVTRAPVTSLTRSSSESLIDPFVEMMLTPARPVTPVTAPSPGTVPAPTTRSSVSV